LANGKADLQISSFNYRLVPEQSFILLPHSSMLALAEDAIQDAFQNAFRTFDGFQERSSLRTWQVG